VFPAKADAAQLAQFPLESSLHWILLAGVSEPVTAIASASVVEKLKLLP
jgi:hypothetical protein